MINNEDDIEGYKIANIIVDEYKLDYEISDYDNYEDMIDDLYDNKIDGAFVQSGYSDDFLDHVDIKKLKKIIIIN